MKQRIIAAAFLATFATAALAQEVANPVGDFIIVQEGDTPPAGYSSFVPNYKWEDGRFVRDGSVYQSLHAGD